MKLLYCFASALVLYASVALITPNEANSANLQRIADMPTPRAAHTATRLLDGRVLIAGGCHANGCEEGLSKDALLFDPATNNFNPTGSLREARVGHRAVILKDGSVLLIGGWTANGVTASIERYVPAKGIFERYGQLLQARDGFSATALQDGTILIAGGYTEGMRRLASAERYDPRLRQSKLLPDMTTARMAHTATLLSDGKVLIAGGSSSRSKVLNTLEIFDPVNATFTNAGQLRKARHKHAAVIIGKDVMILGGAGIPESNGYYNETEIWNSSTSSVVQGPNMREGRYKFLDTVISLTDGSLLVLGSGKTAEILTADRSRFLPVKNAIGDKLAFATATRLSGGRILLLGGYNPSIQVNNGAWLLEPRLTQ